MTMSVTNSMYDERSTPSQVFAQGLGYFGGKGSRHGSPPILRNRPGLGYFGGRAAPGLGYFGGRPAPGLGDASINPFTGGDTGVSDPIAATGTTGFNFGSVLTGILAATPSVVSAATSHGTIAAPKPVAPASGLSVPLVVGGIAALGLLGVVAFGGRRK